MNHELKISIGPCHFRHRIQERMKEIGNSVYYHEVLQNPEILLFKIKYEDKSAERRITEIIKEASSGISYFKFLINGFEKCTPDKKSGLSFRIETSPEISEFCKKLEKIFSSEELDFQSAISRENLLYIPVINYTGYIDTEIIWRHTLQRNKGIGFRLLSKIRKTPQYKIRNFVLPAESFHIEISDKNGLLKSYDLIQKRWFNKTDINKSEEGFKEFRRLRSYESSEVNLSENEEIYLISDIHLGHSDIIWGAARPFLLGDSKRMNKVLIRNWNNTIKPSDTVYYIGDLTYNMSSDVCNKYISELNGNIIFIKGNHDNCIENIPEQLLVKHSGREFLLIHDPKFRPEEYSGWMIHGHVHNSRVYDYPFIDFRKKTINVCCELTGYHPVKFKEITKVLDLYESGEIDTDRFLLFEDLSKKGC